MSILFLLPQCTEVAVTSALKSRSMSEKSITASFEVLKAHVVRCRDKCLHRVQFPRGACSFRSVGFSAAFTKDPCTRRQNVIANHSNHNTFGRAEFDMPQFLNDHFTCMQAA